MIQIESCITISLIGIKKKKIDTVVSSWSKYISPHFVDNYINTLKPIPK